ncbi:putative transcription repressor PLATZ family [Helianthus annuus]|nr:putative transcription repressor PLATZ family [Helianthus annuus]KAJ0448237.1 putative transcription repressor PLATZ family [Helianthus annuus]KAJ0633130.1 putative transcription repressor PLATZ family [Helianthus annuus]KAJ0636931.1 putative transcription repressor PLATZ family [Helianthus annuus]
MWLESLSSEKFSNPSMDHEDAKRMIKICSYIRRYVYHDVSRVGDALKLMDCSSVQVLDEIGWLLQASLLKSRKL